MGSAIALSKQREKWKNALFIFYFHQGTSHGRNFRRNFKKDSFD